MVINATDLVITDVNWPHMKPLYNVMEIHVMEIHVWSPPLNCWVKVVPERYDDVNALVVTLDQMQRIAQFERQGMSKQQAIGAVLGEM